MCPQVTKTDPKFVAANHRSTFTNHSLFQPIGQIYTLMFTDRLKKLALNLISQLQVDISQSQFVSANQIQKKKVQVPLQKILYKFIK